MKKIIFLIIGVLLSFTITAQEDEFKTIFGNRPLHISGFAAPIMSFTTFNGEFAHMMGGGGGVVINDFFFGGFGQGLTTSHDPLYFDGEQSVEFGFGGFWLGQTFYSKKAIHPAASLRIGWGGITIWEDDYNADHFLEKDGVFVLIPTVELEANVTRFLKMGLGVSYRIVEGVDLLSYNDTDFSDLGVFLSFKFGWFDHY